VATNALNHGRDAASPTAIPPRGWLDIAKRVKQQSKEDDVSLLAGGVAFFALLALVPALVAIVSIYGLFASETTVTDQVSSVLGAAPEEVRNLVEEQLRSIVRGSKGGASLAAIIGIALALWSASSGMGHLIGAINLAYDEHETRGFIRVRTMSLALTVGAVVFLVLAFGMIAILPAALAKTGLAAGARILVSVLRWAVLLFGMLGALSLLYRYAPDRKNPKLSWTTPGALFATVGFIVASLLFSFYTANFGRYNETYGTLGAIVVVMLWLWLTALMIIVGAELNAELERQTRQDTTVGEPVPMGEREAYAADTLGPGRDQTEDRPAR
jgi:membrane protein